MIVLHPISEEASLVFDFITILPRTTLIFSLRMTITRGKFPLQTTCDSLHDGFRPAADICAWIMASRVHAYFAERDAMSNQALLSPKRRMASEMAYKISAVVALEAV
jgi:hypothetical protein